MKLIKRNNYLERLINVIDTPDIKVLTGIRRSGKSKLLEAFKKYINTNIEESNIIHINFNIPTFEELMEYHNLYNYIEEKYIDNKKNFILIDEIQMCDGFEKAINGLHALEKYDIYITGSNAFLMSSDLATLFTGRTFCIDVYPFSFKEYLEYYKYNNIQDAFDNYVKEGGMSGSYLYKTQKEKYDYDEEKILEAMISDVYNTLIVRDINQKYKIRNIDVLNNLNNYLMDNISNLTSSNNITNVLNNNNVAITDKTITNYINYLCNAFAFYKVSRYDIRGKKLLSTQDKFYLSDHAFRYALLGTTNMDYGRIYENIVAIELLRRGYEIYVGTLYNKEIDFVASRRNEKIYIQVSDNISDEQTLQREVKPLLEIKDAYPKIIIARTRHDNYQYEGIQIFDIANWLAE